MLYSITNSFVLFYLVFTFRSWIIITSEFDHTNLQSDLHINIFIIRYQQPSQDLYAKFALL